jgi:hypothetical protein
VTTPSEGPRLELKASVVSAGEYNGRLTVELAFESEQVNIEHDVFRVDLGHVNEMPAREAVRRWGAQLYRKLRVTVELEPVAEPATPSLGGGVTACPEGGEHETVLPAEPWNEMDESKPRPYCVKCKERFWEAG